MSNKLFKLEAIFLMKVFDLYQLKKQKAAPLTTQDIVFTKLDPTGGVKVIFIQFKVTWHSSVRPGFENKREKWSTCKLRTAWEGGGCGWQIGVAWNGSRRGCKRWGPRGSGKRRTGEKWKWNWVIYCSTNTIKVCSEHQFIRNYFFMCEIIFAFTVYHYIFANYLTGFFF